MYRKQKCRGLFSGARREKGTRTGEEMYSPKIQLIIGDKVFSLLLLLLTCFSFFHNKQTSSFTRDHRANRPKITARCGLVDLQLIRPKIPHQDLFQPSVFTSSRFDLIYPTSCSFHRFYNILSSIPLETLLVFHNWLERTHSRFESIDSGFEAWQQDFSLLVRIWMFARDSLSFPSRC